MEQWKEYRLGEIGKVVGGATPSTKDASNYDGDISWITPKDLSVLTQRYIYRGERMITLKGYNSCSCKLLPKGSVLFSSRAPIGYVAIASKELCTNQGFKSILPFPNIVDSMFLYYLLVNNRKRIEGLGSGTTFKEVSLKVMQNVKVKIPSMNTQHKIASVLSSIDDKIELNRKINSNLEEQAKALFKSWFIDFEPFKDGKFVDSELGKIPEGWEVCPLEQMGKFKRGKTIVAKNTKEGTVPVVAGGMEPAYYNNVANTKGPVITVSASGANAGFMRLYFQDIWASDCSFLDNTNENLLWIYCFLDNNRRVLRHAQTGAVQPHVKPADINSILVCVPVHELIDKFQNVVRPLFLTIGLLQSETMRLQRTRDTLLPKLMSGEIKV